MKIIREGVIIKDNGRGEGTGETGNRPIPVFGENNLFWEKKKVQAKCQEGGGGERTIQLSVLGIKFPYENEEGHQLNQMERRAFFPREKMGKERGERN